MVPVIAVLLTGGLIGAAVHDPPSADVAVPAATTTVPSTSASPDVAPPPSPSEVPTTSGEAPAEQSTTTTTAPLGRAAVPAPGTYRYEIDAFSDGESSLRTETRAISILEQGDAGSVVQVVAESEGERQISVLDWSSDGVIVRTTRIEREAEVSQDCAWDPPFVEFGALERGSTWAVDSRCSTEVAGLPTEFVVTGDGGVRSEVEVVHAGSRVRAWQVDRSRTTVITATVGDEAVEQRVVEEGTFFIDPARGLVLRSDVTVTLSGAQQFVSRRTSVLTE